MRSLRSFLAAGLLVGSLLYTFSYGQNGARTGARGSITGVVVAARTTPDGNTVLLGEVQKNPAEDRGPERPKTTTMHREPRIFDCTPRAFGLEETVSHQLAH